MINDLLSHGTNAIHEVLELPYSDLIYARPLKTDIVVKMVAETVLEKRVGFLWRVIEQR